uniref:Uncharacterized protein n=1 Tax=Eptatretus burgeri TaxID=7764 RepID=A0A8C4QRH5_EPTBU
MNRRAVHTMHHSLATDVCQVTEAASLPLMPDGRFASLKDLCVEDKRRIANLVQELARVSEECAEAQSRLIDERSTFMQRLQQQDQQLTEYRDLQCKYAKCMEMLDQYQHELSRQHATPSSYQVNKEDLAPILMAAIPPSSSHLANLHPATDPALPQQTRTVNALQTGQPSHSTRHMSHPAAYHSEYPARTQYWTPEVVQRAYNTPREAIVDIRVREDVAMGKGRGSQEKEQLENVENERAKERHDWMSRGQGSGRMMEESKRLRHQGKKGREENENMRESSERMRERGIGMREGGEKLRNKDERRARRDEIVNEEGVVMTDCFEKLTDVSDERVWDKTECVLGTGNGPNEERKKERAYGERVTGRSMRLRDRCEKMREDGTKLMERDEGVRKSGKTARDGGERKSCKDKMEKEGGRGGMEGGRHVMNGNKWMREGYDGMLENVKEPEIGRKHNKEMTDGETSRCSQWPIEGIADVENDRKKKQRQKQGNERSWQRANESDCNEKTRGEGRMLLQQIREIEEEQSKFIRLVAEHEERLAHVGQHKERLASITQSQRHKEENGSDDALSNFLNILGEGSALNQPRPYQLSRRLSTRSTSPDLWRTTAAATPSSTITFEDLEESRLLKEVFFIY